MNDVPSIFNEQRLIESFDVDVKGRLKPQALFAYLTNSAWKHASLTDHGYQGLSALNQMWVLVKFQLSIDRFPKWGDQIMIETWGKGTEKLYALRDYRISLVGGGKLASATSAWMILDRDKRRPLRVDQMIFPWKTGVAEMNTDLKKVPELANGQPRATFHAAFSDIDPNGHVTAMRYLQWVMDSHPRAFLEDREPGSIEISFLAESAMDDEVTTYVEQGDHHELWSVQRASDRKDLSRVRIGWKDVPA